MIRTVHLAPIALLWLASIVSAQSRPAVEFDRFSLPNGLRIVYVHVPDATRQTVFTFLPLTIASDDKDRAQWSHLLEHMLIRSTDPVALNPAGMMLNGETTTTYLRMESVVEADKWIESLERHAQWLTARQFDAQVLEREKINIAGEEQNTAANGFTAKFALAAWNQIINHGATQARVHGDVASATVDQVQQYAAARVPINNSVVIASIGPAAPADFKRELDRLFGPIPATQPSEPPPAAAAPTKSTGVVNATWDLPTRHAMWWWTLPDRSTGTLAAASCLARSMFMRLRMVHADQPLFWNIAVHPFVDSPSGPVFVIDCCLPQNVQTNDEAAKAMEAVWTVIRSQLDELVETAPKYIPVAFAGDMLVAEMNLAPRFHRLRNERAQGREMLEAQWLLTAMNQEYPWNLPVDEVGKSLWKVDPVALGALMDQVSGNPAGSLLLTPGSGPPEAALPADGQ